jgi:hypothetical protein
MAARTSGFKSVSKDRPCPVCKKDHKCSVLSDGLISCGRYKGKQAGFVDLGPSENQVFHLYRRADDPELAAREEYQQKRQQTHKHNGHARDWQHLAAQYQHALTPALRDELASDLGVPASVMDTLQAG